MDIFKVDEINIHIPNSKMEIKDKFNQMLSSKKQHIISFINPEIIMQTNINLELKEYLLNTEYNFVDGIGLLVAINRYYKKFSFSVKDRYPGTDFCEYLPSHDEVRIFLYGAVEKNCIDASKNITKKYEKIKIAGYFDGYTKIEKERLIDKINQSKPDILIVCLGCPRQEQWIKNNKDKIDAKIILGNGGAIDFWSGNVKRAPSFFISHKIEWFYRLLQDFSIERIKRQLKLVSFVLNILFKRIDIQNVGQD